MGAYCLAILKRPCRKCGSIATYEVFNTHNSKCGYYCKRHADEAVNELDKAVSRVNKKGK